MYTTASSTGSGEFYNMVADKSGTFYIAGIFGLGTWAPVGKQQWKNKIIPLEQVQISPLDGNQYGYFVAKFDPKRKLFEWVRGWGGDEGRAIIPWLAVGPKGTVYVTMPMFGPEVTFPGGVKMTNDLFPSYGRTYVVKFGRNGEFLGASNTLAPATPERFQYTYIGVDRKGFAYVYGPSYPDTLPSARTICGKVVDNGFSDGYTQYFGKISSLDCRHAKCGLKGCPPLP